MSTSYPFLTIARNCGADYSAVLLIADMCRRRYEYDRSSLPLDLSPYAVRAHERLALFELGPGVIRTEIWNTVCDEMYRRALVQSLHP